MQTDFHLLPWIKACDVVRVIVSSATYKSVMQEEFLTKNRTMFIVREDIYFTSEGLQFLKDVNLQSETLEMPVKVVHTTSKVLSTSIIFKVNVIDQNDNVLLKATMIMVLINSVTGRPMKFPDTFRNFINSQTNIKQQHPLMDQPLKTVPADTPVYSWSRHINMLDTDGNGHANHTLYHTTSLQCLESAWFESFVVGYHKSFTKYVVKCLSCVIHNESHNGQTISVQLWQTENKFNFVLNAGEKVVACITILLTET